MESNWRECDAAAEEHVAKALSEVYDTKVAIKSLKQRDASGLSLSLAKIAYWRSSGEDDRRIKETVMFLDAVDLDLPKFELQPKPKGIFGSVAGMMGMNQLSIDFPDTPRFSENYMLHSWVAPATKILFTPDVRQYFIQKNGWRVRGSGTFLVVVAQRKMAEDAFIRESLQILSLLKAGEEVLDGHPDVERVATPESMMARTRNMGVAGSIIASQLRKVAVTASELDAFKNSPTPRQVPPGMKKQILGANLIFLWLAFLFFGIVGIVFALFVPDTMAKFVAGSSAGLFGLIGLVGTVWTTTSRGRKMQSLRAGDLVQGKVTDINSTSMKVGEVSIFKISVAFQRNGSVETFDISTSGESVSTARRFLNSEEPVTLLVGEKNVVCVDFMHVTKG